MRPPAASAGFLPLAYPPGRESGAVPGSTGLRSVRRGIRWRWGRFVLLVVALYSGWMGQREWSTYRNLHQGEGALARQAAVLAVQYSSLKQEIAYAQTTSYVAAAARQEFGFVTPDQVPLAPVPAADAGSATSPAGRPSAG